MYKKNNFNNTKNKYKKFIQNDLKNINHNTDVFFYKDKNFFSSSKTPGSKQISVQRDWYGLQNATNE